MASLVSELQTQRQGPQEVGEPEVQGLDNKSQRLQQVQLRRARESESAQGLDTVPWQAQVQVQDTVQGLDTVQAQMQGLDTTSTGVAVVSPRTAGAGAPCPALTSAALA